MVPQQHFSDKGTDPLPDVVGRLPSLLGTESAEQPDLNVMILSYVNNLNINHPTVIFIRVPFAILSLNYVK